MPTHIAGEANCDKVHRVGITIALQHEIAHALIIVPHLSQPQKQVAGNGLAVFVGKLAEHGKCSCNVLLLYDVLLDLFHDDELI